MVWWKAFFDRFFLELFDKHLEDEVILTNRPENSCTDLRDQRWTDLYHKLFQFFLPGLRVMGVLDENQRLVAQGEGQTQVVHGCVCQVHF